MSANDTTTEIQARFEEFLTSIDRLIRECRRKADVEDVSVIDYMLKRLTSCQNSIQSLLIVKVRLQNQSSKCRNHRLEDLCREFKTLIIIWKENKRNENKSATVDFSRYSAKTCRTGMPGRLRFNVDYNQIEELLSYSFSLKTICNYPW